MRVKSQLGASLGHRPYAEAAPEINSDDPDGGPRLDRCVTRGCSLLRSEYPVPSVQTPVSH